MLAFNVGAQHAAPLHQQHILTMRLNRIYLPGLLATGNDIALTTASANHVARVLRMRAGETIAVFNGKGGEFRAELIRVEASQVTVRIGEHIAGTPESPLTITLVQGVSRSERMDWALQKATELGVNVIAPVLTARSVVRLDDKQSNKKQEHWHNIVIGACEQSGRSHVPQVLAPVTLRQYLQEHRKEGLRLVLSPTGPSGLAGLTSMSKRVELLIGPEGGLDDEEIERAQNAGFVPVRLGPRVLRTETAAVTALTVLQAMWGDLS
jgi:16S rRNA (uracil1498-N3)-methyltransferase